VYNRPTVDENVGELAAELRISLGQIFRRVRAEHSLPMGQGAVLGALDREGPKSISDLAAGARMRPQSMAQTVRELEDRGFVARSPDPGDGRRSFISLTAEGLRHLEADRRLRDGWLAQVLDEELSESERETMRAAAPILRRIADSGDPR
jgi:DNA-binding MarR family transcriptional regulator